MSMFGRIFIRRATSLAQPLPKISKGTYAVPNNPKYKKLMDMQTHFCAQDGKLVWEKMPYDLFLYRMTIGLVSLGFLMTVHSIYTLATPPKNE